MSTHQDRTPEENMRIGALLARSPAIRRNSNLKMPNGDKDYEPGNAMSSERAAKVVEVIRSLSSRNK